MSKQTLAIIAVLVMTLGCGIAIGFFLASGDPNLAAATRDARSSSNESTAFSPEARGDLAANTLLSNRIRELEKERTEQQQDQRSLVEDRMALFKKYRDELNLRAIDGKGVSPEIAEILGLTKEEQAAVNKHLADTMEKMGQLQAAHIAFSKQTSDSVIYDTPIDPQGKVLQAELVTALAGDIGQDKADFLMASNRSNYNDPFAGFAQQEIQTTISWTQQNGVTEYTWKETALNPNGSEAGSSWSSGTTLPPVYQKLLQGEPSP